jgi:hypothetical protein
MAFNLNVHLDNYEYRTMRTGTGANGAWMSLVFENPEDARQIDVSVPQDMQSDIYNLGLTKGDIVSLDINAYAGVEYSRIRLIKITSVVDADGEVQY